MPARTRLASSTYNRFRCSFSAFIESRRRVGRPRHCLQLARATPHGAGVLSVERAEYMTESLLSTSKELPANGSTEQVNVHVDGAWPPTAFPAPEGQVLGDGALDNPAANRPLLSVAPMMDWTDVHFRQLARLLSRRTWLWTEMVVDKTVLHTQNLDKYLWFPPEQRPLVLQLGGSDPDTLAEAAAQAVSYGYDEINLNCGCPSDRVAGAGCFGAALMQYPALVARCMAAMAAAVQAAANKQQHNEQHSQQQQENTTATSPSTNTSTATANTATTTTTTDSEALSSPRLPHLTVKCRLGVDDVDSYQQLVDFVRVVSEGSPVRHFIIHARKAFLNGLSPHQNRTVPPLRHQWAWALAKGFPHLQFSLNGGLLSCHDARAALLTSHPEVPYTRPVLPPSERTAAATAVCGGGGGASPTDNLPDRCTASLSSPSADGIGAAAIDNATPSAAGSDPVYDNGGGIEGVMIGRGAYNDPWGCLADADRSVYGEPTNPALSRRWVIARYREYAEPMVGRWHVKPDGHSDPSVRTLMRPLLNLFHGAPGCKRWKAAVDEVLKTGPQTFGEVLDRTLHLIPDEVLDAPPAAPDLATLPPFPLDPVLPNPSSRAGINQGPPGAKQTKKQQKQQQGDQQNQQQGEEEQQQGQQGDKQQGEQGRRGEGEEEDQYQAVGQSACAVELGLAVPATETVEVEGGAGQREAGTPELRETCGGDGVAGGEGGRPEGGSGEGAVVSAGEEGMGASEHGPAAGGEGDRGQVVTKETSGREGGGRERGRACVVS